MSRCRRASFNVLLESSRLRRKIAAEKVLKLDPYYTVVIGKEDDNADNTLDVTDWDCTCSDIDTYEESSDTEVTVIHRAERNDSPNDYAYLAFPETATDLTEKDSLALVRRTFGPQSRPLFIRSFVKISDRATQTSDDVIHRRVEDMEAETVDHGKAIEAGVVDSSTVYIDRSYTVSDDKSTESSVINARPEKEEEILQIQNHNQSDSNIRSDETVPGITDMSLTSTVDEQSFSNTRCEADPVDIADKEPIGIVFKTPAERTEQLKEPDTGSSTFVTDTILQMQAFGSLNHSANILEDQKQRSAQTINDRDELYNSDDSEKTRKFLSPTQRKRRSTSSESEVLKGCSMRRSSDFDNLKNPVDAPTSSSDRPEMIQTRSPLTFNCDLNEIYNLEDSDNEELLSLAIRKHRKIYSETIDPERLMNSDFDNLKNSAEAPATARHQPEVIKTRSSTIIDYDLIEIYNSEDSDKSEKIPSPAKRKHRKTSSETIQSERRMNSDFDNLKNSVEDSDNKKLLNPAKRKHRKVSLETIEREPVAATDQPEIIETRYNLRKSSRRSSTDEVAATRQRKPRSRRPSAEIMQHKNKLLSAGNNLRVIKVPQNPQRKISADEDCLLKDSGADSTYRRERRKSSDVAVELPAKYKKVDSRRVSTQSIQNSNNTLTERLKESMPPQKTQQEVVTSDGDTPSKGSNPNWKQLRSYWSPENTIIRIIQAQNANIQPLNLRDLVKFSLNRNEDTEEDNSHGQMRNHIISAFSSLLGLTRLNLITMDKFQENNSDVQNIKVSSSLSDVFNKKL